ncbi:MAG: penicillin-binding protein, partial [Bacteroidetes bacterium]|nr:penicillin-binding protein [Bacteroidota bacterium]
MCGSSGAGGQKDGHHSPIDPFPSIAPGTADVSVFEMVAAYCTSTIKGCILNPQYILRIEDKNGVALQDFVPRKIEAISEETAYLMPRPDERSNPEVPEFDYAGSKYGFTNPIAGKTGTTQNNSDGWFMGITPGFSEWGMGWMRRSFCSFQNPQLGQGANVALPTGFEEKVFADPTLNYSKEILKG